MVWIKNLLRLFKIGRIILDGPSPSSQRYILGHRNIFVLPSGMGVIFFLCVFIIIFIGLNYQNNMALLFGFLLGSTGFITVIYAFLQLHGLAIEPGGAPDVFVGEVVHFEIVMEESAGREREVEIWCGDKGHRVVIESGGRVTSFYEVRARKRGWVRAPKFEIRSLYPLGIFRAWSILRFSQKCVVYPAPKPPPPFVDKEVEADEVREDRGEVLQGLEESTIEHLEEHLDGESYRRIYWRVYARDGRLVKKVFKGESSAVRWFSLETFKEYPLEDALGFLCYLIKKAQEDLCEYGLILDGEVIYPSCGELHMRRCLRSLALYGLG